MHDDALELLGFPAIADRLANASSTPRGVELVRALTPSSDEAEVTRRQELTAEAIALLDHAAEPPLHGIHDVREAADRAARGGALTTEALAAIVSTVAGGVRARAALEEQQELAPLLREQAEPIEPTLASLAERIARCVEEDGSDLRDNASPRLRKLRRELRDGRQRVADELRRLARSPSLAEHLQEDFVAMRGGRPVLAVKVSSRSSVKGIVHDASGSGQTLFVEPFEVVELSNRQSEAIAEEREEVERILRELSAAVGERAGGLNALVEATGAIDLVVASGTLSRGWRGAPVTVSDELQLLEARHPLLDPATAVPIDLDLGDLRALVVSGPNTGGKTVALKTLGLAAMLHQSGLRPPAETAALPVFDQVLADIGDPQSIEMSLSTFSGHVSNLIAILRAATGRSLVLVDELASGTDPAEGSALAQALLARLAGQARLTVVTTHFPELKEWASATEGAANAATGIDPDTHEPLYRIALGRPGTSHALQTAERLGLDGAVVATPATGSRPSGCAWRSCSPRPRLPSAPRSTSVPPRRRRVRRRSGSACARASGRASSRRRSRRCARRPSGSARRPRPRRSATSPRLATELDALRKEIRAARRRHKETRRAPEAERERDRRLGAASVHATRVEEKLRRLRRAAAATWRRSRWATPSRSRESACAARSRRSTARRRRSSAPVAIACGSRSRDCDRTRTVAAAGRRSRPSACSPPRGATSPTSSTCEGAPRRRRARPCARSSTRPRSPGFRPHA